MKSEVSLRADNVYPHPTLYRDYNPPSDEELRDRVASDPKLSTLSTLQLHRLYFHYEQTASLYISEAIATGRDVLVTKPDSDAPLREGLQPSSDLDWVLWMFQQHWPRVGLVVVDDFSKPKEEPLTDLQAAVRQRMTVLDRRSIRALPPVEWLVKGIIRAKAHGMIFSAPKTYKSFVVLDATWALAEGRDWAEAEGLAGFKVREACDVLYCYGESLEGLQGRLRAKAIADGRDPDDWPERLHFMGYVPRICDKDEYRVFRSVLDDLEDDGRLPRLVVLDTFTRAMVGFDQKSDEDVSLFYFRARELVRDYDLTVLSVHHTGHQNTHREFGSSVHYRELDFRLKVEADKRARVAVVEVLDQKEDAEFSEGIGLQAKAYEIGRDEDGEPVTSLAFRRARVTAGRRAEDIERMLRLNAARDTVKQSPEPLSTKALAQEVARRTMEPDTEDEVIQRYGRTLQRWFERRANPKHREHASLASFIVSRDPLQWFCAETGGRGKESDAEGRGHD